jgi:hypothetical protein
MRLFFVFLLLIFYAYSIIRYHIGVEVPLSEWLFVFNKSLAWFSFTLFGLSMLRNERLALIGTNKRNSGITGLAFGAIHILISITLLLSSNDWIWKKLDPNSFHFYGFIAFGSMAFLIYLFPLYASIKDLPSSSKLYRTAKFAYLINLGHPFLLGYKGWFTPENWPYYFPPITLLVFLSALLFFWMYLVSKKMN